MIIRFLAFSTFAAALFVQAAQPRKRVELPLTAPAITATAKGPDQINLTWSAAASAGYGYLVEITSTADTRYPSWTELKPIPTAGGYTCDRSIVIKGATCAISDPGGTHVYNSPVNGIPYWVTEPNYVDPQDDSPAQFIAVGLQPNTEYSFRVRTYSGISGTTYGIYSNTAAATTANYTKRYVSPSGSDANSGVDTSHAWKSLSKASAALTCGQVLIVMGGNYPTDSLTMGQKCSAGNKAVVLVNPGDTATLTSAVNASSYIVSVGGAYNVIDGLKVTATSDGGFRFVVNGDHNSLFNVETRPTVIPDFTGGVNMLGHHHMIYGSYLHDSGSPDQNQNPSGGAGYILVVQGVGTSNNAIWSNHLTRGGHDGSLCKSGCSYNRWLNNIMDGGWGMAFATVEESPNNLQEGNIIYHVAQLEAGIYKPAFEISAGPDTARRNVIISAVGVGLEVSALVGATVAGSLIYNNSFYDGGGGGHPACYFQSQTGGVAAYDKVVFANNICYKFPSAGIEIYLGNATNVISHNTILLASGGAGAQTTAWNRGDSTGVFQYPQTIKFADTNYPPFSKNANLAVVPQFVNQDNSDFHLAPESPLFGAGMQIIDTNWGSTPAVVDLGPYGISIIGPLKSGLVARPK